MKDKQRTKLSYPDGTVFYTLQESPEDKKERITITLDEFALTLLYVADSKPILGKTRFVKEIFLAYKDMEKKYSIEDFHFVPYHYGPYSFRLMEILDSLIMFGLVETSGNPVSNSYVISLTQIGKKEAEEAVKKFNNEDIEYLRNKRIGWDQMTSRALIHYTYNKYEEYTKWSKIKHKFEKIEWGK